jgi:hypothetical protein
MNGLSWKNFTRNNLPCTPARHGYSENAQGAPHAHAATPLTGRKRAVFLRTGKGYPADLPQGMRRF